MKMYQFTRLQSAIQSLTASTDVHIALNQVEAYITRRNSYQKNHVEISFKDAKFNGGIMFGNTRYAMIIGNNEFSLSSTVTEIVPRILVQELLDFAREIFGDQIISDNVDFSQHIVQISFVKNTSKVQEEQSQEDEQSEQESC